MEQNPFVSVIIPVYNGSNFLNEAVDSVLSQSYDNYEIIIVDDGSLDTTWDIIQGYVAQYPNKIRGYHKENGGVSTALNFGIRKMYGEWFAWLSHDDLWLPNRLEKQMEYIKLHPNGSIYYSNHYYLNVENNSKWSTNFHQYPRGKSLRVLVEGYCFINGITVLIRKKLLDEVGFFDEQYRCVQDLDMWVRLALKSECLFQPDILAILRVHSNQTGATLLPRCRRELYSMQAKYFSKLSIHNLYCDKFEKNHSSVFKLFLIIVLKLIVFIRLIKVKYISPYLLRTRLIVMKVAPDSIKKQIETLSNIVMKINYK